MQIGKSDLNRHVYIIAELSANHNGSLQTALRSIEAAKECGADAVKLQTYTADTITLDSRKKDFMIAGGTLWDGKSLHELYEWAHTPWQWHKHLFAHAKKVGIDIFSSPFDASAVDFLARFDPPAYKIASFEVTDPALVYEVAKQGKPVIISTGIATKEEIAEAVEICRGQSVEPVLLQCTSAYPAPPQEANLRTLKDMGTTFDVTVGFSDHTLGITAPVTAVSLGARVLEKHFIIDKALGGPDAKFSLDVSEFKAMVQSVRECEKLLGEVVYNDKSKPSRRFARSLYVSAPIKKSERFSKDNIKSVRPGYGLHPKYLEEILGQKADRQYQPGDRLVLEGKEATYEA